MDKHTIIKLMHNGSNRDIEKNTANESMTVASYWNEYIKQLEFLNSSITYI